MRITSLDLLRCAAIFLVFGRHLMPPPTDINPYVFNLARLWKTGGWVGVDVFFVLSGFLVAGLLFREQQRYSKINTLRFLARRGFKIYPAFWAFIIVSISQKLLCGEWIERKAVIGELLFLQNYLGGLWPHTWSLAIEEHFYILLALLLAYIFNRKYFRIESLPKMFAVTAIICFALRLLINSTYDYSAITHIYATHLRIDSLFFGVILSYYWHYWNLAENNYLKRYALPLLTTGCVLLLPAFLFSVESHAWIRVIGVSIFYLGSGALLISLLSINFSDSILIRGFSTIGQNSYSIYLWHLPASYWSYRALTTYGPENFNWYAYAATYILSALLLGFASYYFIERPFLRLRDKQFPSKSSSLAIANKAAS